jgi:hypothetical protein
MPELDEFDASHITSICNDFEVTLKPFIPGINLNTILDSSSSSSFAFPEAENCIRSRNVSNSHAHDFHGW